MILLAETIGQHPTISFCGSWFCTLDVDSLVSSGIAILVTLALGFFVAYRVSHGVPGKLQMVLEFLLNYIRQQVEEAIGPTAPFVIPLAATIFVYILVANWIEFFPLPAPLIPANADINQTVAMALVVFIVTTWYSFRELGVKGYLRRFTKPFDASPAIRGPFVFINIVEEIAKPLSLALRLFGNIFAGTVMIFVITLLLPGVIAWLPLVVWKFFDVFVIGTIQAFIFMLLTIIYFGMAREGLEEEGHAGHGAQHAAAA
ncbi:MAG TPA: F0F1 ATP synthase subunit A [Candidatus Limnocylindrales bacterium]|nr:F0F1 ATP synthase subunit A [Candidatus Limnocylindrales bacterium]